MVLHHIILISQHHDIIHKDDSPNPCKKNLKPQSTTLNHILLGIPEGTFRILDSFDEFRLERRVILHFLKSKASRDKIRSNTIHGFTNQRKEVHINLNPQKRAIEGRIVDPELLIFELQWRVLMLGEILQRRQCLIQERVPQRQVIDMCEGGRSDLKRYHKRSATTTLQGVQNQPGVTKLVPAIVHVEQRGNPLLFHRRLSCVTQLRIWLYNTIGVCAQWITLQPADS